MKILHLIPDFSIKMGGPALALESLCNALNKREVEQTVVSLYTNDFELSDVEMISCNSSDKAFGYSLKFKKWLKANLQKFDLVQIHSIWLYHSYLASNLCRKYKIPYVVRLCGMLDKWSMQQKSLKKNLYLKLIEKKNLQNAWAIHCATNEEVISSKIMSINKNVIVCPIPINRAFFSESQVGRKKNQLLFLGRLHYKKQPELLIEALADGTFEEFKLVIAGDGDKKYVESLKSKVDKAGLTKRVDFRGFISGNEKISLFRESSFFILPSLQENFGVAVAESMASGCVPVVSQAVALSNTITQENCGIVFGSNKIDLHNALKIVKGLSSSERATMSNNSKSFAAKSYHPDIVADQFLNLYKNLVNAKAN